MQKVQLAFYKGGKGFISRTIAWWKKSTYTHVEIKIGDFLYSSSELEGGVRIKSQKLNPAKWDIVDLPFLDIKDANNIIKFFDLRLNCKYDWWGIIKSQIFGASRHSENRYFCSEICAEAIGLSEPNRYCPQALYNVITDWQRLYK